MQVRLLQAVLIRCVKWRRSVRKKVSGFTSTVPTARRQLHCPNHLTTCTHSRSPIPFARRSERFQAYEHIGLYAYRKDFLLAFARLAPTELEYTEGLEQLRALEHGYRIRVAPAVACRTPSTP